MIKPIPDFASEYGSWLTSRISQSECNGVVEVSTPLLDLFNDGMRVYIEKGRGGTILHDGGLTLETLALHGVDVHSTPKREAMVDRILRSSGLTLDGDRIQTEVNDASIPQRMHFLLSAMHRISDLSLTVRQGVSTDFFERVCGYLDERNVLYSTHLSIPGKTVAHPVDIVIPLPRRRERLVRLIGTPNINAAKIVSFSWIEIAEVRPDAERVILLNDEGADNREEIRSVSQQTETVLQGYSTAVYRWSQRVDTSFEGFWRAA